MNCRTKILHFQSYPVFNLWNDSSEGSREALDICISAAKVIKKDVSCDQKLDVNTGNPTSCGMKTKYDGAKRTFSSVKERLTIGKTKILPLIEHFSA